MPCSRHDIKALVPDSARIGSSKQNYFFLPGDLKYNRIAVLGEILESPE